MSSPGKHIITSGVLLVLAGGASAYTYFDRGAVSDADRAARASDVFPSFRMGEVRRVELVQGPGALVLERPSKESPEWMMTMPRRERANAAAVDALMRELEMARRVRDVPDREAIGLDSPRVRGRLSLGPLDYAFELGADAPRPAGAAYMRVDGEGAFVVGQTLKVQLLRTADAYRDRALVPYGASDVERLDVASPGGAFSVERRGATFRVGSREGLRASRSAIDRLFGALADTRVDLFVDDAQAERETARPTLGVTVTPRDESQARIRLVAGAACPNQLNDVVVVRLQPTRVSACIAKGAVDSLGTSADALIDRSVLFARADEVEEMRLESLVAGGPRVELARRAGGWRERSPDDRELSPDEVDAVNALLAPLAATLSLDSPRADLRERIAPRTRATFVRTGAAANEVIELAAPAIDGSVLARRDDDGAILRLSRDAARRFEPHPVALRGRSLWPSAFDAADVIAIDNGCAGDGERIERRDNRWQIRAPAGFAVDPGAAADIADFFARAKADRWLVENDDGGFGLGPHLSCTVSLTLAPAVPGGAPRSLGIVFGAAGDGGYYARTLSGPAVFLAPVALRERVAHPVIDRSRFRIDPAAVTRVSIVRAGVRQAFKSDGARLVRAGAGPDAADDPLADALAAFSSEAAIHIGPPAPGEGFDHPALEIEAATPGDAGGAAGARITVGGQGRDGPLDVYFARVTGVDATFSIARPIVDAILDATHAL